MKRGIAVLGMAIVGCLGIGGLGLLTYPAIIRPQLMAHLTTGETDAHWHWWSQMADVVLDGSGYFVAAAVALLIILGLWTALAALWTFARD